MNQRSRNRSYEQAMNVRAAQRYVMNQMRSRILHPPYESPWYGKVYGYSWRLALMLGVLGVISYGLLKTRMRGPKFRAELAEEFSKQYHATNVHCGKTTSPMFKNSCSMVAITAEGAEGSFFTNFDAHFLEFDLGFQFLRTDWTVEQLAINQLAVHLRTGSVPPVMPGPAAPAAAPTPKPPVLERAVIPEFKTGAAKPSVNHLLTAGFGLRPDFGELVIKRYELPNLSLTWGYSTTTEGGVLHTLATLDPAPEGGWKLLGAGGEFSQNWLKGLKLENLEVLIRDKEVTVVKANLAKGQKTSATIQGKIHMGEMPQLDLDFNAKSLDLRNYVPEPLKKFFFATADLQGKATGTLNQAIGMSTQLHGQLVEAAAEDSLPSKLGSRKSIKGTPILANLTHHFALLHALSVASGEERLDQAPITSGSFDLVTGNSEMTVSHLDLQSTDLLCIRGGFTARELLVESKQKKIVGKEDETVPVLAYEVDTDLRVGLNPAVVQAMPEAIQSKYFTDESEGFRWMIVKAERENFEIFTKTFADEMALLQKEALK